MNQKTKEFRQHIADAFVQALSEKGLEWKKGWVTNPPINAVTGKRYKGLNHFSLSMAMFEYAKSGEGYDNRWATFKQVQDKGWKVKKGAKGQKVEYWQPYDFEKKAPITWEELSARQKSKDKMIGVIAKYYVVFNGKDIEGIPELPPCEKGKILSDGIIEKISTGMGVEIRHDGAGMAFYRSSDDSIHLPETDSFYSSYAYNATALHELSHATGAKHRLNRNIQNFFGTESYAYEELVAEISSCFMGEHLEIIQTEEHIQNHKAYVTSWIQSIKERPEALIAAIRDAGIAANYLEYHAGIISKEEYQNSLQESMGMPQEKVREESQNVKNLNGAISRSIEADLKANGFKPSPALVSKINELNRLTGKEHSIKGIQSSYRNKSLQENTAAKKVEVSIVKMLQKQELAKMSVLLP